MRRALALLAVLALAGLARALPASADARTQRGARARSAERELGAAERELARGNARAAERRLSRALGRNADDPRLLLRYAELALPLDGQLAADTGALSAAATSYLGALERARDGTALRDEDARRLLLHAAWAAALLARYDDSLALALEAGQLQDRPTLTCLRQIAALAVRRDLLAVAERALTLAKQYVPQEPGLALELGRVLLARGQPERAVLVLSERFALEPQGLALRRDLAYALASAGRARQGHALLSAERARCEADPPCALEAARIALEAGELDDALAYAARRLAASPSDLDALFVTADALLRAGQLQRAREAYERVLRVHPESARAKQALAELPRPEPASNPRAP